MKSTAVISAWLMVFLTFGFKAGAQAPPPAPGGPLEQLLAPIALYPDPLIAQILPAATLPSQVAVAYSYISQGGDPNAIDAQPWDPSIKALARYPDVLKMMNDNLSWTAQLGQAFLEEQQTVMDTIQQLRAQAQALGNLGSTPQMTVDSDDGFIDIEPTDPDLLYVPIYDPGIIFYQRPYGRRFLTFGAGFHLGIWLNHDFDWHNHRVIVWGRNNPRPANWWRAKPADRRQWVGRANPWRPPAQRSNPRALPVNRGNRGYQRPPARVEPPRQTRPAPPVNHVEPRPGPVTRVEPPRREPAAPVRPVAPPVQVHITPSMHAAPPARTAPSAFTGVQGGASQTRAASSRGTASRGGGGAPGNGGGRKH